jgi:hypothetical protein
MGGGLDATRKSLGFGLVLCECSCHAACSLAGQSTVSWKDWNESCSCPGADRQREEQTRRGDHPPDFRETLHATRQNRLQRRQAIDAVRSRSTGKSPEEIRQLIMDEFRARNLTMPSDQVMDVFVHSAMLPDSPLGAVRMISRAVGALAGDMRQIVQLFRDTGRLRDPNEKDPYFCAPGGIPSEIDVLLDAGAEQVLDAMSGGRGRDISGASLVPVWLELAEATQRGQAVIVHVEAPRVGILSREDSLALKQDLETAKRQGRTVMMLGGYVPRPPDGSPQLRIWPAGPPRR